MLSTVDILHLFKVGNPMSNRRSVAGKAHIKQATYAHGCDVLKPVIRHTYW